MKNDKLQKADYAGEIGAALAVIRRGQSITKPPSGGRSITKPPAPKTFDLHCFCAVHDKPYTLRFVEQSSGLLRFKESIKGEPSSPPDNCRENVAAFTMRLDCFENGATPCAWCGDRSFHHCASFCGALVCGGRMTGNTFHCRKSCGASWVGVPLQEVKGSMAQEAAPRRASMSPAARPTAAPAKPVPTLTAGHEARASIVRKK